MRPIITESTMKSLRSGIQSLSHWYSAFGVVVAAVAVANFLFSLLHVEMAFLIAQVLGTYRAIVHGAFDWLTYFAGWKIPGLLKDVLFVYGVIGGSFMRSRLAEGIYPDRKSGETLYDALRILIVPSKRLRSGGIPVGTRMNAMYQMSPQWLRMTLDFALWPRVLRQYLRNPMVYRNEDSGLINEFKPNYTPRPSRTFLHDRRLILVVQFLVLLASVFAVIIINAFLVMPGTATSS